LGKETEEEGRHGRAARERKANGRETAPGEMQGKLKSFEDGREDFLKISEGFELTMACAERF
jgi:hypothetical protein